MLRSEPLHAAAPSTTNALTVDVEEYYHGLEFEAAVGDQRTALPSRVEDSVDRVLGILADAKVSATFFVLGCVARGHRAMVRRIVDGGHEIACHGDAHELVSRQPPVEFRLDVRRAKESLEDIIGQPVIGYRAPNYSIDRRNLWAFDVLLEEGFRYDSSVYPIYHDRYGFPNAPRGPHVVRHGDGGPLWEFPLATVDVFGVRLPIGGGGPFRLLPCALFRSGIRRTNRRDGQPAVFYFHPWELDAGQPRPPMPLAHRFRHYVNLHRMESKIVRLLNDISFASIRSVMAPLLDGVSPLGSRAR
jgi:polysaccharide deacetylase family protein (PEP-CTERM system associated)